MYRRASGLRLSCAEADPEISDPATVAPPIDAAWLIAAWIGTASSLPPRYGSAAVPKLLTSMRDSVSLAAFLLAPLWEAFGRMESGTWESAGVASSVPRLAISARRPIAFGIGS
jgi:hypothetical protein